MAQACWLIYKVTVPIGFYDEKEAFGIMVVEAVKGYIESTIAEYENATSQERGRIIGEIVGTVVLALIDGIGTVKVVSSFVRVLKTADNLKDIFKLAIGKKAETIVSFDEKHYFSVEKLKILFIA